MANYLVSGWECKENPATWESEKVNFLPNVEIDLDEFILTAEHEHMLNFIEMEVAKKLSIESFNCTVISPN